MFESRGKLPFARVSVTFMTRRSYEAQPGTVILAVLFGQFGDSFLARGILAICACQCHVKAVRLVKRSYEARLETLKVEVFV